MFFKLLFENKIACFFFKVVSGFKNKITSHCFSLKVGESASSVYVKSPCYTAGLEFLKLGVGFYSESNLRIEILREYRNQVFTPVMQIGDNVSINFNCHIGCVNKILIGNNVLIASNVFITDHSHGSINEADLEKPPKDRALVSKGAVIIEDNVWIGDGVSIFANVTIGKNSIIGANSVVTKSIPENCVAVGTPAQVIKNLGLNE
ncbi:DapH/DapD/GlmU-related protein [Thiomicrorhabdus sp. 6S3-12]|uniref:DapH/DapD/GlmU-related protein n=1 Tax=Thiomicrorhabdus sp. 6S3-12 TaxID=2819681 RepID=UPI002738B8BE|nr:DapH/DapD/GlmU-related protein [Thiomicrorhabdus sp. 6S3-12]